MNSSSVPTRADSPCSASRSSWRFRTCRGSGLTGVPSSQIEVGDHERRAGQPRGEAQRVEVGHHHHVAVAAFPGRHRVAGDRVHLDVDGEQVVAALGAVLGKFLEEQPRRHALADETALHVGERDDHGVDLAGPDQVGQLLHRQVSGLLRAARVCQLAPPRVVCRPLHHGQCRNRWEAVTRNLHLKVDNGYQ